MRRTLVEFDVTPEQLEAMFAPSNELTIRSWEKRWMDNIIENMNARHNGNPLPVLGQLVTKTNRHISMVCGAGPSLRKLRKHAANFSPDWGLLVTDHALKLVLECGLKPTLVVTMDGHQETEPAILEGFKMLAEVAPDTPVITDLVCCPSVVELIKNPYFFRSAGDPAHVITRYIIRECPELTLMGHGGNVASVCLILAKHICYSRHVMVLGMDSAMKEGTLRSGYWYPREMPEIHQYLGVCDIYGRSIQTMANLHNYKWWADHFCYSNDEIEWINVNDGGFLGVQGPNANYNHYTYMTLPEAFKYLKEHGEDD